MGIGIRVAFSQSSRSGTRERRRHVDAWIPSELRFITPIIDWIVRLVEESQCAVGNEDAIELALQEALNNALIHGNGLDRGKQIRIRRRSEQEEGVSFIVSDQGQGFDSNTVPDPLLPERLLADHGRGLDFMRALMDEVHFERGGTEVHFLRDFHFLHSFNYKLDDRDQFQQNAKTSVTSLRGLIGSSRNIDRHQSGMLIDFIGITRDTRSLAVRGLRKERQRTRVNMTKKHFLC